LIGEFAGIHWSNEAARLIAGAISGGKVGSGFAAAAPPSCESACDRELAMHAHYSMFAGYNAWCNARLYAAAAAVSDADYRADRGAFFRSLHGTLNHLLVGDRIWMHRFTGEGELPKRLDVVLYDEFAALHAAREAEDARISRYVDGLSEDDLAGTIRYRTIVNPVTIEQPLAPALDHFFNHQTHHRGQAHALLSAILGNDATPSFDLIIYQRETGRGGARTIG
jgi:uncharacterized damage-inducible protein DinB